jgi:hypothetical protein
LLLEPAGALSTLMFCLAGYGFLRLIEKIPKWGVFLGITPILFGTIFDGAIIASTSLVLKYPVSACIVISTG